MLTRTPWNAVPTFDLETDPAQIAGAKCVADAGSHEEAQAFWAVAGSLQKVGETAQAGGISFVLYFSARHGRIIVQVLGAPGRRPIEFWGLPKALTPDELRAPAVAEPPMPGHEWRVNVIRTADDAVAS